MPPGRARICTLCCVGTNCSQREAKFTLFFFFFFPKEGKSFSFPETGEEEEQPVQSSSKEQRNSPLTDPVLLNSNQ